MPTQYSTRYIAVPCECYAPGPAKYNVSGCHWEKQLQSISVYSKNYLIITHTDLQMIAVEDLRSTPSLSVLYLSLATMTCLALCSETMSTCFVFPVPAHLARHRPRSAMAYLLQLTETRSGLPHPDRVLCGLGERGGPCCSSSEPAPAPALLNIPCKARRPAAHAADRPPPPMPNRSGCRSSGCP